MTPLQMIEGADLPDLALTWKDRDGNVLNLSSYTFTVKVGPEGGAASITKTSGITGSSTAPNIVVAWTVTEIGTLSAGRYVIEVIATATDSRERRAQIPLNIVRKLS